MMMNPRSIAALVAALFVLAGGTARAQHVVRLAVSETAGIRRTEFPVRGFELRIPNGTLQDVEHMRLRTGETDVAAQFDVVDRHADGTPRVVSLAFNVSIGPGEVREYRVEYGRDTVASAKPPRGLSVAETPDSIQVGSLRFSPSGSPLIQSANYRGEFIGPGPNGVFVVDAAGNRHDFATATDVTVTVSERGPLAVTLLVTGRLRIDESTAVTPAITLTMPNSKSWVEITAAVSDNAARIREIGIDLPLALGPFPWTWDFGTANATYGAFRSAADSVTFRKDVRNANARPEWSVSTRSEAAGERVLESSTDRAATGWAHLVDGTKAVAIVMPGMDPGVHAIRLAGDGRTTVTTARREVRPGAFGLKAFYHFVSAPVAIGAATSPASILAPLQVTAR